MRNKTVFFTLALILLLSAVFSTRGITTSLEASSSNGSLTSQESQVLALVNGTKAYNYDLELQKIALDHSVSNYAFRSGGSVGATATATWLKQQFENLGLTTQFEQFEFTNWNLPTKPRMTIDEDGDNNTTHDQNELNSFQSEHFSWHTPLGGVFADLVVLPLPAAASYSQLGTKPINTTLWNSINTLGKIVLIGREVRWNQGWNSVFWNKIDAQPPAAVVYTWWYPWVGEFAPPFFSSVGGHAYWDVTTPVPVGWVSYEDGLLIRNRESSVNVSAKVTINSIIGSGPHYNVVARLQGQGNPDKFVIVSGHYDTVMTAGFVDNGAGTSGVLELAQVFSEAAQRGEYTSNYTLLFIGFASEELGLIGSTHYVKQHKADMQNIVAIINLDSIGNDNLQIAQTDPDQQGLDLDTLVLQAAQDLDINAGLTSPGGSDQEVFRNPSWAENSYSQWWPGLTAGISDAAPVESSTMIVSDPLFISDRWNKGEAGWLHTAYDNSTSTQPPLSWLEVSDLEEQIKVAALSVMRISPSSQGVVTPFSLPLWVVGAGVIAVAAIVFAVVVYLVKVRKPPVQVPPSALSVVKLD